MSDGFWTCFQCSSSVFLLLVLPSGRRHISPLCRAGLGDDDHDHGDDDDDDDYNAPLFHSFIHSFVLFVRPSAQFACTQKKNDRHCAHSSPAAFINPFALNPGFSILVLTILHCSRPGKEETFSPFSVLHLLHHFFQCRF